MVAWKSYIIAVIAVCICCGIVRKFVGENKSSAIVINTLCGTILAITVISPFLNINTGNIDSFFEQINIESAAYTQNGLEHTKKQLQEIISDKIRAYVLEKTSSYNCSINSVQVYLTDDDTPMPYGLQIEGVYAPYVRNHLADVFEKNLGISKENQQWIYQN